MHTELNEILKRLENFSNYDENQQLRVQNDLLRFASANKDQFVSEISSIKPEQESVLFEVYEALSKEPEAWIDFLLSEFERIRKVTENSNQKEQASIASPLISYSLIARKEFAGNEKLIKAAQAGTFSSSTNIVTISIELLSDIYTTNKSKYHECKVRIQECQQSDDKSVAKLANKLLIELEGVTKMNRSQSYSIFKRIYNLFSK